MSYPALLAFRVFCCIVVVTAFLYLYIDRQNELIALKLKIPMLEKELKLLREENCRLQYSIDCFENPNNLLLLLQDPTYRHLKFPNDDEIIVLPQRDLPAKWGAHAFRGDSFDRS